MLILKKRISILGIAAVMLATPFMTTAQTADASYLNAIKVLMTKQWPNNRTINFVFQGGSVPAGYFKTPNVQTLKAYPHQTLVALKKQYPYAVLNCIVEGVAGENSAQGANRFDEEVLTHHPDVLFIDYAINDGAIELETAKSAWKTMIEAALAKGIKVVLLTPTPVESVDILDPNTLLAQYAEQIRELSRTYQVGLVDSYETFRQLAVAGENLCGYMSGVNHPNEQGHKVVTDLIMNYLNVN
jgi:hypothetical protein